MTSGASQPAAESNDAKLILRLPASVKDALSREAARYGVGQNRPVPLSEYVRAVLTAHATQARCPCGPLCSGG